MSLADTIGKLKSVSNSESKGIFSKNNKSISSRFSNLGKLLSRSGINAGKDPANISDSKINSVAISSKNIDMANTPIIDKPTSIEPSTNKPSYETLTNNTDIPSVTKGSYIPKMSPVALSPASNITKAGNNTSTISKSNTTNDITNKIQSAEPTAKSSDFTSSTKADPKLNNTAIASSFKFDEKNNDNKLLEVELKTQTRILKDMLVELKKTNNGDMLDLLSDLKKSKKTPSVKKPSKLLQSAKTGIDKAKNVLKRVGGAALDKLGSLASKSKSIIKTAANIAKNSAAKGMTSGALQTGARVLSKALPVAAAAGVGWEAGSAIGDAIYDKYQNTDFMKGVGATVAKGAAFFGSSEAKQAVKDTEKYDSNKYKDFGSVAARFESGGNAGTISTGHGDAGGKSYGKFQLASKQGNVDKFIKDSGYSDQFKGLSVGSKEFDAKWKDIAKNDKNFDKAQTDYIAKTHYQPLVNKLKKDGIDLSKRGQAVQEMIMSTGVQYGGNTSVLSNALKGKDVNKMTDEEIIKAGMAYKKENVGKNFSKNSAEVQAGVSNRYNKEEQILLAKVKEEEANKKNGVGTNVAASSKEKAIDKNVKTDTTTKTDTKVADNTKAKVADKPTSHDKSSSDRVVAANENKKQDTNADSKIAAASKEKIIEKNVETHKTETKVVSTDKSKTESKIDAKMASVSKDKSGSKVVAKEDRSKTESKIDAKMASVSKDKSGSKVVAKEDRSKTEAKIDAKMASASTEKQIDLSVGPVTTSLAPSTKLAEVDTKYIETSQAQKEDAVVEKSQPQPQPQTQQVVSSSGNKGAVKSAMQSNAQSSKAGDDTPNIEVRKQTSTIQRVFDRDSSLMV